MIHWRQITCFNGTVNAIYSSQRDPLATADSAWRCLVCDSMYYDCDDTDERWFCSQCLSTEFYNPAKPTKKQGEFGTWVYMPSSNIEPPSPSPGGLNEPSRQSARHRRRRRRRHGGFPGPDDGDDGEEQAESEMLTNDALVDVTPIGSQAAP